jgi:hypothetical protein
MRLIGSQFRRLAAETAKDGPSVATRSAWVAHQCHGKAGENAKALRLRSIEAQSDSKVRCGREQSRSHLVNGNKFYSLACLQFLGAAGMCRVPDPRVVAGELSVYSW